MAEQILYGIVEEVLKKLGSSAIDEIALTWNFKDRLERLKKTMNTIKNVLLDAEERQADSPPIRDWLERLAGAVYQADDLFDEVATIASRKHYSHGNKLSKEHFTRSWASIQFHRNTQNPVEISCCNRQIIWEQSASVESLESRPIVQQILSRSFN